MEYVKFIDLKPYGKLAGQLNVAYDRVFNSGTYIGGQEVEAFERAWADYCGAEYCVGVGNGFDALYLACKYYADIYFADRMYVPWKTCLPTWAAVRHAGITPSFDTGGNYVNAMAVHIYGQVTMPPVKSNYLIEDCAQAHGATLDGNMAGNFGNIACWSFYPTKNLGALGDAGAVTTDSAAIYEYICNEHNYGMPHKPGVNSRLDPLQAAFLRVKLAYLDGWNSRRKANAETYLNTIKHEAIKLPEVIAGSCPNWHIFAIETNNRDDLMKYLRLHNVETMIHYPAVPYPSRLVNAEAEQWTRRTLSLPVAPHVTPYICGQIAGLINQWAGGEG